MFLWEGFLTLTKKFGPGMAFTLARHSGQVFFRLFGTNQLHRHLVHSVNLN